ncbi:SPOC like C-terminal domain-containing protein [Pisolithus croceorrhizus]|nr:SPOC like C-terminal domain-containing protein [Pisolithus croceorrhizus]KAI6167217.1 SPOC like C-terminal domain-containing protein [Pisolithus thermaeus]
MSFDNWNVAEEEGEEELQDTSFFEGRRDVILFCVDCSQSMQELRDDVVYEDVKTSHLLTALDAAMQVQKKKTVSGPNDWVGILLYNTSRPNDSNNRTSEIKKGTSLYQPLAPIGVDSIQELIRLIEDARDDPEHLKKTFPPLPGTKMPMGDVFTSCNWVLRDSAPKTASKRIFLITDDDNPSPSSTKMLTSARTTLIDLMQSGCQIEPFFISSTEKPFDVTKFYSSVLPSNVLGEEDSEASGVLPDSISITRIDDLLEQMRFHEQPKRAVFNVPFELGKGFTIGVKGYGLVTEQKKGSYLYFIDLGDRMEVARSRTVYVDEEKEAEVSRNKALFGMKLGADEDGGGGDDMGLGPSRVVKHGQRPFYTADEVQSFRTLGLDPGIKLLGFKDKKELAFEDNVKHSIFIYPDELKYSGSKRTFSALLQKMLEKRKIGLVRALVRRNSSPVFCALLPQAEKVEEGGWCEPGGFHLIVLPFADDIRAAPIEEQLRASEKVKDAAKNWIDKLCLKNGTYPPDSYPNPSLAYHNAQLQAVAFREEFDDQSFEDLTRSKYDMIHKRAGALLEDWKKTLVKDENFNNVLATSGVKRKADISVDEAELRSKYESGELSKLRMDQLKDFLRNKGQSVSGKKVELIKRVEEYLDNRS